VILDTLVALVTWEEAENRYTCKIISKMTNYDKNSNMQKKAAYQRLVASKALNLNGG
jgi:hypothetical protein